MENSDVLDAPEVQPTEQTNPTDATQPVQDSGATVINNMYTSANKPSSASTVVAENNHADSIANAAMSNAEAKQTYSYTGAKDQSYDESVNTRTTLSNGQTMNGVWNSEMKMDKGYTVDDSQDYKWNKLANEMASLKYAQEEAQARYESIQAKQEIDQAASQAWNQYFGAEYAARQTQDKMGWSGGQQTASDLQVAFLQAETASNMFTKDEMQKYGVETKLGIARMYADAEQRTLALQYYQDAVDQAIKEAEQTGCYVPPEASEMFAQDDMARKILNDSSATKEQKARAKQVLANTQKYYDSKGFSHWDVKDEKTGKTVTRYYGIETLQRLNYLETVRSNKAQEALQDEANKIARAGNAIAREGLALQEKQLEQGWAVQNWIQGKEMWDSGTKVESAHSGNYYVTYDANGKATTHSIGPGSTMSKTNKGQYYYRDSKGDVYPVYNSDYAHGTEYGNYKNPADFTSKNKKK